MRGRVGVESVAGQGATFWMELPLTPTQLPRAPSVAPGEPSALPPLRLLVADDIAPNRILMRAMLGAAGHDVTLASDGAEALAQVQAGRFDAVLMDVRMPGMDGLEATRRIRALPSPRDRTLVIAVTASALSEEIAECRAAGMDAHIAKPVDREALFALLRRLRASAAPATPAPGRALVEELGTAGRNVAREFAAELAKVVAELERAEAGQDADALRALLHRGLGAAATLGAGRVRAAIEEAEARLRRDGDPAAAVQPLRERLRAEMPALQAALDAALGVQASAG
jgi:CheY-like chemotaxis protein